MSKIKLILTKEEKEALMELDIDLIGALEKALKEQIDEQLEKQKPFNFIDSKKEHKELHDGLD